MTPDLLAAKTLRRAARSPDAPPCSARRGFTLIEVVVATGIVGATLAALAALVHTVPLARITQDRGIALAIVTD